MEPGHPREPPPRPGGHSVSRAREGAPPLLFQAPLCARGTVGSATGGVFECCWSPWLACHCGAAVHCRGPLQGRAACTQPSPCTHPQLSTSLVARVVLRRRRSESCVRDAPSSQWTPPGPACLSGGPDCQASWVAPSGSASPLGKPLTWSLGKSQAELCGWPSEFIYLVLKSLG